MLTKATLRACCAFAVISTAIAQSPVLYEVQVIDASSTQMPVSVGRGLNDGGASAGRSFSNPAVDDIAWTQKHGQIVILPPLAGYTSAAPSSINNRGDTVGASFAGGNAGEATLWPHNGPAQSLGLLPGQNFSFARAINNAGEAVGYSGVNIFDGRFHIPTKWVSQAPVQIVHPGYTNGAAFDVAPNGTIVGGMWNLQLNPVSNELQRVDIRGFFTDKHGQVTILDPLPGGSFTEVGGIARNGVMMGHADSGAAFAQNVYEHAIIRQKNGNILTILPPVGYQVSFLITVNESGAGIGGFVDVTVPSPAATFGVMHNLEFFDLDSLLVQPPNSHYIIVDSWDINASGAISAAAVDVLSPAPAPVAVVLHPTPNT